MPPAGMPGALVGSGLSSYAKDKAIAPVNQP
jgi:hypothetical protein